MEIILSRLMSSFILVGQAFQPAIHEQAAAAGWKACPTIPSKVPTGKLFWEEVCGGESVATARDWTKREDHS
jgi:hypothetical protein